MCQHVIVIHWCESTDVESGQVLDLRLCGSLMIEIFNHREAVVES